MPAIHGPNYGRPTLDLNFAKNKSLIDTVTGRNLVTFGRAQANYRTTYVGADGLIKYAAADEPRFDHNPLTGECLGLLVEEQRTNLATYSQNISLTTGWTGWEFNAFTVTQNAAVAPDGTTTATLLEDIAGVGSRNIKNNSMGSVSSSVYTVSCFFKKATKGNTVTMIYNDTPYDGIYSFNFDNPSGNYIAYPNGWYRIWFTTTTARTNMSYVTINSGAVNGTSNTNVYLWGYQVEAGTFPTSYIPTSGSTVTRSADSASITGTNFTSFYNQSEGTLFANYLKSSSSIGSVFKVSDGTFNNRIDIFYRPSNINICEVLSGGTTVSRYDFTITLGSSAKQINAYQTNNFNAAYNGTVYTTDTSGTVPTVNKALIGSNDTSVEYLNGTISRLTYYPTRLQDFQLQQLTK